MNYKKLAGWMYIVAGILFAGFGLFGRKPVMLALGAVIFLFGLPMLKNAKEEAQGGQEEPGEPNEPKKPNE